MQQKILKKELAKIVANALQEDCAFNDVTSDLTIAKNSLVAFEIKAREEIIFCGKDIVSEVFLQLKKSPKFKNSKLDLKILAKDGARISPAKSIARGQGDAKLIFAAERVILNLIQHLSGVATLTQKFAQELANKKIKILDTRKTLPGLRALEKYAVVAGGGKNHRFNLSDMILIKDNHIAAAGSVANAIEAAKSGAKKLKIEVECDTPDQVAEAVKSGPHIIMLDNMKISEIKKSIKLINKKAQIEISGGVNLQNIKKYSALEIDFISVGSLTHSARAVDIGLDII
ncbi:MAG: carboxylating nicotinate-nucleotide diphosphorylase [Rickettsiales bacterium]|nr:carboxylating nicotinate-nucleotide diphosphorylase [Rickettsiales bacterium]